MTRYFDSSFVLAVVLGEGAGGSLEELWRSTTRCIASNLLAVEGVVNVRRAARVRRDKAVSESWLRGKLAALDHLLRDFDLKAVDQSIEEIIRDTPALAECRTLDAIHLATALHFRPAVKGGLEIVTLDKRMAAVARKLGLTVVPT